MWGWLLDAPLIFGVLPAVVTLAGAAGMGFLLVRRGRSWWRRVVPVALAGAALGVLGVVLAVEGFKPFPDSLPARVLIWVGVALFAVALAAGHCWSTRWWRSAVAVPALLLVVALSIMKINAFYQYQPTLGAALGLPAANEIEFSAIARVEPTLTAPPGRSVSQVWHAPADLLNTGRVTRVEIPGTRSGFRARQALVYLPPAYLTSPRPLLPVVVLIAGQPGGPQDWLTAGTLAEIMDRFAAAHAGLAPVVVLPDATGSALANPLCMDSRLGNAETYLVRDVPEWITANLQADPDPRHWAIGGFSYGGTCALQLAVRAPQVYPTFLDGSGQDEPSLGSHDETVAETFGGDETKFRAVNPLDLLAASRFPASAGVVTVGRDDPVYGPEARRVVDAAQAAGMSVQLARVPGGHTWAVAITALQTQLPWLAARLGLITTSAGPAYLDQH